MKNYVIKVKRGSTDQVRVKKYLEGAGIDFGPSAGISETEFIRINGLKKSQWKQIKKDLNLAVDDVYCTFKELKEGKA